MSEGEIAKPKPQSEHRQTQTYNRSTRQTQTYNRSTRQPQSNHRRRRHCEKEPAQVTLEAKAGLRLRRSNPLPLPQSFLAQFPSFNRLLRRTTIVPSYSAEPPRNDVAPNGRHAYERLRRKHPPNPNPNRSTVITANCSEESQFKNQILKKLPYV